jgi:hypothetical protein
VTDSIIRTLARYEKLHGQKQIYLNLWQEIGEFCYPAQQNFTRYIPQGSALSDGQGKRRRPIFDSTPEQSLDIFASSMVGMLANPASKWVNFQVIDSALVEDRDVQLFIDEAQQKVLSVFNNPRTKFYDNLFTALKMIGAFGTASMLVDSDEEDVAKFRVESPRNFDFTEDFSGNVDEVFFEKEWTVDNLRKAM